MFRTTITSMLLLVSVATGNAQVAPRDGAGAINRTQHTVSQEGRDHPDLIARLLSEITKLKSELQALQREVQQRKIAELEREWRQTKANSERLAERESEVLQQLAALDQQLGQPSLSDDERKELEVEKTELAGDRLEPLRAEQQAVADREAETAKQLEQERQRWQSLLDKWKREK